jgi:ATP-dependent Clp protease ATP-binding subunit ClpA
MVRFKRRRRGRLDLHDDTRAILEYTQTEAVGLDHDFVGSGHILLGLLRLASGQAARVLAARTDLESARAEVRRLVPMPQSHETSYQSGHEDQPAPLPFSPHAREALQRADREAEVWSDDQIEPEHLLMGILRERGGTASKVLDGLGVHRGPMEQELQEYWQARGQSRK